MFFEDRLLLNFIYFLYSCPLCLNPDQNRNRQAATAQHETRCQSASVPKWRTWILFTVGEHKSDIFQYFFFLEEVNTGQVFPCSNEEIILECAFYVMFSVKRSTLNLLSLSCFGEDIKFWMCSAIFQWRDQPLEQALTCSNKKIKLWHAFFAMFKWRDQPWTSFVML